MHPNVLPCRLVESLRPFPGQQHLDVAGGTGDVAFRVLRAVRAAELEERMAAAGRRNHGQQGQGQAPFRPRPQAQQQQQQQGPGQGAAAAAGAGAAAGSGSGNGPQGQGRGPAGGVGGGGGGSLLAPGRVVVCDINPDMLRVGQQKAAATSDLAGGRQGGGVERGVQGGWGFVAPARMPPTRASLFNHPPVYSAQAGVPRKRTAAGVRERKSKHNWIGQVLGYPASAASLPVPQWGAGAVS